MQIVYRLKLLYSYCSPDKLFYPNFLSRESSDFFISKMICLFYAKSYKIMLEICFILQKQEKMFDYNPNVPEFGQLGLDKLKIMFYNIYRNNVSDKLFHVFEEKMEQSF